ncbi:MAG: S-layer homology domain-containing protein, partial [Oscillospiraceae bacterium]|nr:S-layer homology domain-containing protein [Oscillospiraceae bacterium]
PFIEDKTLPGYDPSYYKESDGTAWYSDGTSKGPVQHTYIAYYLHEGLWHGSYEMIKRAISTLTDAFVYTGDAKYGRAGAILLDRVADFYPSFNWKRWDSFRGDGYRGKILDPVWENAIAKDFARAYDAFIPIYNDPYLAEYLSKKSPRYEMDENGHWKRDENGNPIPVNLKNSPGALRKHVEDNILLELYDATVMSDLAGNFGMTQTVVVAAAVALNRLPETAEMLEWVMKPGTAQSTADNPAPRTGGATMQYLIEQVDRDGNGNENAPGYNRGWVANLIEFAELLSGYELYPSVDLFKNARFINMFDAQARLTLGGYYGTQTGDSGAVASRGIVMDPEASLTAFRYTGDRDIARALYMYNGDTAEGLRGSILDDDPEKVTEDIERIVEEDGEYALESDMMTGYGFAALRAGAKHNSASLITETNTNRDFAIYFGASGGHGHKDGLNLFASAFGLNVAPDIGYPEQTGDQPNRYEWVETTISHNTVIVDENEQEVRDDVGTSHHFDDSGRVKLMDISKDVYEETDDYRRSMIMVEVDDEISYGVDFFHINGGNDHMYSFHSQSDEISAVSGLSDMTETPMYEDVFGNEYGTYAGADVKYGPDPGGINNGKYPRGYTWLRNIRTFNTIEKDFSVEFKVKDWNKVLPQKRDIRLRLTMVNDDPMEEVTFAMAYPPRTDSNANIGNLEYLLVRNKGSNLNTTFTTVLEPYEAGNKYIKSIEKLPMERQAGTKPGTGDSYGAVRVELENGRIDYIIYSTNSEIDYIVDGNINFRGFAGVISFDGEVSPDAVLYSYLNDGEVLKFADEEKEEALAAYTGTVKSYTDELKMENSIVFTPTAGQTVDTDALSGKYVYIDNDGIDNSAYRIESAKYDGDDVVLNIGTVSVIRSYVDANDIDRGYVYNIEKGQSLRIPLSAITSRAPVVEQPDDYTVSAGSTVTIPINAESMSGKVLTLIGTTLPRGMSINQETKTLTWKPDDSQGGENHVAVTASDGVLETTVHFTVTVYGRTTGSSTSTDNSGTSGGGGGGAAPIPDDSASENTGTDDTQNTEKSPEASGETDTIRFTYLSNHAWAEDAINTLAADGIIKGTSASTYSPAKNITRADFALLLVRAFKLESENAENFADVAASDYFAAELAIARNNGIISGIGDNKYAPRNTITRQDMMVIVHRALTKLGVELESADVDYGDFTSVAEYAQDAVEALITSGLVNGKSGKIAPTDYTTRAEVAVLIKRILDYIK